MNIKIYQLTNTDYLFISFDRVIESGRMPTLDDYKMVYEYEEETDKNTVSLLNDIYSKFNVRRPEDFHGHSLSVSDVIVINDTDKYYVDRFGFKKF